jgi:hypothetical protein
VVSILARYQKALGAYDEVVRRLRDTLPASPPRVRQRLEDALETFLPVIGECLADLPGVLDGLADLRRRLEKRKGSKAERSDADCTPAVPFEPLLRAFDAQAARMERMTPLVPPKRRREHEKVANACRQVADRLRGLE